jgi:hypothetical protein
VPDGVIGAIRGVGAIGDGPLRVQASQALVKGTALDEGLEGLGGGEWATHPSPLHRTIAVVEAAGAAFHIAHGPSLVEEQDDVCEDELAPRTGAVDLVPYVHRTAS